MIEIGEIKISLDRKEDGANVDFISHAHSDHISAARSSASAFASEQTAQLLECAYGIKINRVDLPDGVKMVSAGHMLGSRQLCVDDVSAGKRVVYTGDFQMQRSKTSEPITIVEADSVIMDSTYYEPSFSFCPKEDSERAIMGWLGKAMEDGIVLFSAYKMGKAQELISIFNQNGVAPVVSRRIGEVNKVYEKNNVRLDYLSAYDIGSESDAESAMARNFVGVTEARDLSRLAHLLSKVHGKRVYTAVATGFAGSVEFSTDMQFTLSDHADFGQSRDYINATGASNIYTFGQNGILFARNLRKEGYNASALSEGECLRASGKEPEIKGMIKN